MCGFKAYLEVWLLFWCIFHHFVGPEPISAWSQRKVSAWLPEDGTPKSVGTTLFGLLSVGAGASTTVHVPVINNTCDTELKNTTDVHVDYLEKDFI